QVTMTPPQGKSQNRKASAVAVSASSGAKKFASVPTGTVIVAVFGIAQPAASSGASGVVTVTGTVMEPPMGIATAPTVPQASGGPPRQTQGAGKGLRVAVAGMASVKLMGPRNG